jgi:hypothetical protein
MLQLARRVVGKVRRSFAPRHPPLGRRVTSLPTVFRAPPLTPELIAAIKLISPHWDLRQTEHDRRYWEADQNGLCWTEYDALYSTLLALPPNARILEIGPGMGRSLVFFSRKLRWRGSQFHAYEGDADGTKRTMPGPRFEDSFCGNIPMLRHVLDFNGLGDVTIHDAAAMPLAELPGPYDLIFSFDSVGFHWSLDHFLDDLLPLMTDGGMAIFTTTPDFAPAERLRDLPHRIINWTPAYPRNANLKCIVIRR